MQPLTSFLQGFALGASLIIAIGAQNAFVLRQGLKRAHPFATALVCFLCDVSLIALGVAGAGALFMRVPLLTSIATWGGALFLFWYGALALRAALRPLALPASEATLAPTLRGTVATALALSLLNPHVYLDTVVLLGSIGAGYAPPLRPLFALGAMLASGLWFFGLAYGASWLAPLFRRPRAWQLLDLGVALVMWGIGATLLLRGIA